MQLDYELDEFYPFRLAGGFRLDCAVYGTATITYNAIDDWYVSDVIMSASNGKLGKHAQSKRVPLAKAHPLFKSICDALETHEAEFVQDAIRAELEWWRDNELAQRGKDRRLDAKIWGV